MQFKHLTHDEALEQRKGLKDGDHNFTIIKAVEGTSKAGANMITITFSVLNERGNNILVTDWLMPESDRWGWKVRHFFEAINMLTEYESGNIDTVSLLNKKGSFILKTEEEQGKLRTRIIDYIKEIKLLDDNIPF